VRAQRTGEADAARVGRVKTFVKRVPGALCLIWLWTLCAQAAPPPTSPGRGSTSPVYVGAEKCGECHENEHSAWKQDWHSRALSPATPAFTVGNFEDFHFKGSSSEAWMHKVGGRPFMRTQGPAGTPSDFPVQWVVGGKRMQDTITVLPDGRWQVLPVYFHVTGGGAWVDYTESKQGALTPDHPFFWANFRRMASRECLDCHTSGLDVRYTPAQHTWSTHFADAGVACESCHGPGARHAESQLPRDIVQPKKLPPQEQLAICASCHGPRNPLFPLLDSAHRYQPGDRYDDKYQALVVLDGRTRSGDFFPDGRPKTSSFEYQALLQSRCYLKGGATCLSCHTAPHAKHGENELPLKSKGSAPSKEVDAQSCGGCHPTLLAQRAQHSHHKTSEGQGCLGCHMPKVVTGVLDTFADHALDVPVPQNTERHGIPNACNSCHVKATPAQMTQAMERWWPQKKARQARRLRLADAIDEATAEKSRPALEAVIADATEAPSLRATAAILLAQRFAREAGPALLPLLKNPSPLVRSSAASALGLTPFRSAADPIAALLKDSSLWVRQSAALTLATWNDSRGEAALTALAQAPDSSGLVLPHYGLGVLAARRGDLSAAATHLDQALTLAPYFTDALLNAADVSMKRGDSRTARIRLYDVLRFDPQHRGAIERLKLLDAPHPK